jgi:hypothetical protein
MSTMPRSQERLESIFRMSRVRFLVLLLALGLGLAQVGSAQAGASVSHFDIVFTFPPDQFTNPCTGTTDTFASELRVLSQTTVAPSGIVHIEGLNDFRGQGDVLRFRQLSTFAISGDGSDEAPLIVNQVAWFLIHEPGAADNAYQQFFLHLTINANGEVTSATQELGPVECRG